MPLDPQTLAEMLSQSSQPQPTQPGDQTGLAQMLQSQQPQQPPSPQENPAQALQPTPEEGSTPSTEILQKPSSTNTPESFSDTNLRGFMQPGAQQIPAYKDDTSPARSMLANMFLGMGSSLTGQKFQSIQQIKYERYMDRVKLQLEQQQRNQQLQIAQMTQTRQAIKDQNNAQFKNLQSAINQERDKTKQAYLQNVFDANYGQNGLKWQQFKQMNDRYSALQTHMQNQDSTDASKLDPQIKDPEYLRAVAFTQANPKYAGQDIDSDPQLKMSFLQDVEAKTMALKAQQAQMRGEASQKPPQALITDPSTGTFIAARPGTPIPAGTQTPTQVGQVNTPTTATRRAGEQGNIIQNVGEELINKLDQNRDVIGDTATYWKKAKNDTPFADPRLSGVNALLKSYIALQPALHGFRSAEAMKEFEKAIGGAPKNVDALISAIRATNQTGGIVSLAGQGKLGSPKLPSISSQEDYDKLPNGAQYTWNGQTLTKGKK